MEGASIFLKAIEKTSPSPEPGNEEDIMVAPKNDFLLASENG
jgi:hypothetical protein